MKQRKRLVFGIILLSITIIVAAFLTYRYTRPPFEVPAELVQTAQTGDLILCEGRSLKSDFVRFIGTSRKSEWSHIGIARKDASGRLWMIHMSSDEKHFIQQPIEDYVLTSRVQKLGLWRLTPSIDTTALMTRLDAIGREGKEFDGDFDIKDDSRWYCTEMLYRLLPEFGISVSELQLDGEYLYPVAFTTWTHTKRVY